MKNLILNTIALGMTLSAFATDGEHGVGNGGVAVVCREGGVKTGKIIKATILDIFEGKNQFGLTYTSTTDPDTMVELAQLKMITNNDFLTRFRTELSNVRAGLVFLPKGVGLTPTNDAFPTITEKGSDFEQLANYKDNDSKIYVDEEIYKKLSKTSKAALLIHEAIYKIARVNQGDTSSVRSRKLTSQVLAANANQGVVDSLMNELKPKPAPVIVPENRLINGTYATENSARCGYKIIVDGDTLYATAVANPRFHINCGDAGFSSVYYWKSGRLSSSGESLLGYRYDCPNDNDHWCGLIQVVNNRTFIYHASGTAITFNLW